MTPSFPSSVRSALTLTIAALAGFFLALSAARAAENAGTALTINEPGFEAIGKWKRSDTGGEAETITYLPLTSLADLVDKVPGAGDHLAYSNGVPAHQIYQVLTDTLAASTAYTISIVAIDRSDTDFSPFQLRLGHVPDEDDGTEDDGIANDHFGKFLLKHPAEVRPAPLNGDAADDGYKTWTTTFITGGKPHGLGKPMRIEIVGRGVQSLFDNVRLEAVALPVVVMLGDSTTDRGMPTVVKKQLDQRIEPLLERPSVINAGKGNDNATSALERLEKDVLVHKPDIVTVSFGLNDTGGRKPEQYGESLKTIVKTLKAADIEVVLMTSTPFNNDRHGWGKQFEELGGLDEYMDKEFCERMRSLADSEDVLLCDLHAIFKAEIKKDADLINKLVSTDGVHLTAEGYDLVAKHIGPVLHKLLTAN